MIEEIHASLQFEHVDTTSHNGVDVALTSMLQKCFTDVAQTLSKHRMFKIGSSLFNSVKSVTF